jgi:hypothetical protein
VRAPAAIAFVTLIASEDTRVSAARWLEANVAPDARVFLPGGPLYIGYVGPTLRPKAAPDRSLAPELKAEIERRTPESFPRTWRFARALARGEDGERIPRRFAGSIIVTAEHGAPVFDVAMTSPDFIRMLERNARLLADFPIEREPGPRVYEPRDLNFSPVAGAGTLLRPGPRIRIWSVPNGEAPHPTARPMARARQVARRSGRRVLSFPARHASSPEAYQEENRRSDGPPASAVWATSSPRSVTRR